MRNSIGKSTLFITASKLASLLMNMGCTMILSRIRTLSEYGTYSQLLMSVSLVSTLFILGLPNSINYFLAKAESLEERRSFLSQYYLLNLILSALAGVVLVLCLPLLEQYYHNEEIGQYAFFLLLYPFASITMSSVESVLVVYDRPHTLVLYRFLNSLSLLLTLVVIYAVGASFRQYMILFLLEELIFAAAIYAVVWRLAGGLSFSLHLTKLRELLVFCIPLGLASAVGALSREMDKLVISSFFTTEEYAIFSNAAKELPLTVLASATTMVVMPKIVTLLHRDRKEQAVGLWKDAFVFNYAVMSLLVFGIVAFAPEAITLLYSEKYLPGVTVFRVYTLLMLLRCTYFGMILNAIGKTRKIFYFSLLDLGLNVILNLLFCWLFGFVGPALATVLVSFVSTYYQCFLTARELRIPLLTLLPLRQLAGITTVNLAFSACFMGLKSVLPLEKMVGNVAEALLLGGVWAVLYAVCVYPVVRKKWASLNRNGEVA